MGKWILDRFELLYFDLKHKRWRLFQENPLKLGSRGKEKQNSPANYRDSIQHFLHSIHEAFDNIPRGTGITVRIPTAREHRDVTKGSNA